MNGLLARAEHWPKGSTPALLGRLDKLTSGIVLVTKRRDVYTSLQRAMAANRIDKDYLAIVYGKPTPLAARSISRSIAIPGIAGAVTVTDRGGQRSVTKYERLATTGAFSTVRCRLITGRTHQIRVHLAAKRWPIVGDPIYESVIEGLDTRSDSSRLEFPRQALHAWRLTFKQPTHRQGAVDRSAHSGRHARARRRIRIACMSSAATARVRGALAQAAPPVARDVADALYRRHPPSRRARRIGRCPRILIKRDDLTTLGLGGNKARKLEYLVADARAQGATTFVTTGAVQSNHARMTAAAACVAGMRCVLVLTASTYRSGGGGQPAARQVVRRRRFGSCPRSTRCSRSAMTNQWSRRWWLKNRPRAARRMSFP